MNKGSSRITKDGDEPDDGPDPTDKDPSTTEHPDPELAVGSLNDWRARIIRARLTRKGTERACPVRNAFFRRLNVDDTRNPPATELSGNATALRTHLTVLLFAGGTHFRSGALHTIEIDPAFLHLLANTPKNPTVSEARRLGRRTLDRLADEGLLVWNDSTARHRTVLITPLREQPKDAPAAVYTAPNRTYQVPDDDDLDLDVWERPAPEVRLLERNDRPDPNWVAVRPEGNFTPLPAVLWTSGLLQQLNGPAIRTLLALRFEQLMTYADDPAAPAHLAWETMHERSRRYTRAKDGKFMSNDWWFDGIRDLMDVEIIESRRRVRPRAHGLYFEAKEYGYALNRAILPLPRP